MIFCALIDPDSIRASAAAGEWGEDHLIGVLQCLLQNCLIAETTYSWRFGGELADAIKGIKNQDARLKAGALLEALDKRSRFVGIIDDSAFDLEAPLYSIAQAQAKHPNLDVIITQQNSPTESLVEFSLIQHFNQSNFAQERQRRSCGVIVENAELSASEFFGKYFSKLHLAETELHVIDYVIGDKFTSNFSRNLPFWIDFCKSLNRSLKFTIHTTPGLGDSISRLKNRLAYLAQESRVIPEVKIHDELPHERFLVTKQFCFEIGRGIDLFDPDTGKNRDIRLGLSQISFPFCF